MTFQYGNRISHKCKYLPLVLIAGPPVSASTPSLPIDRRLRWHQVKHSIVDYMRFIYDFPRWYYEMFPFGLFLLSFIVGFGSVCSGGGWIRFLLLLFPSRLTSFFAGTFGWATLLCTTLAAKWQHLIAQKNIFQKIKNDEVEIIKMLSIVVFYDVAQKFPTEARFQTSTRAICCILDFVVSWSLVKKFLYFPSESFATGSGMFSVSLPRWASRLIFPMRVSDHLIRFQTLLVRGNSVL